MLGRAKVVGEQTKGGANPGGYKDVGEYFELRVPDACATNPLKEGNWEGIKITPDYTMLAEHSLNTAIHILNNS